MATLKSGKAWTGLVKNRKKNGDYYWVEANTAPLIENGRMIGYTSIRTQPRTGPRGGKRLPRHPRRRRLAEGS